MVASVFLVNFGETGPGDFVFVLIWAVATLLLASFYVYKMTQR
jgi:hypothetical protein